MAPCTTRKHDRAEAFEAADGDFISSGVGRKTFAEAVSILVPENSTRVRGTAVSDSDMIFFSDDESDDDWEEDDMLPEEGPEVVDPPSATGGLDGGYVVGRAVEMSTDEDEDEDEYVDIEGTSDSEEDDYDGEVVD